ncbi:hypothetical protein U1Q18_005324 [Sarracenia purpurea var. burkii]
MLAKLLAWLPFWPYAKGIAILLLVVPYFGGASYVYFHFVSPYVSGNLQICRLLLIPNTKPRVLNEQSNTLEAVERSCAGEEEEDDESEKLVIYEAEAEAVERKSRRSGAVLCVWSALPAKPVWKNTSRERNTRPRKTNVREINWCTWQ